MFRFILYFVLFYVLYRLLRSVLNYFFKDRTTNNIKNQSTSKSNKYENIEEAKFTEIKEDDEKKN